MTQVLICKQRRPHDPNAASGIWGESDCWGSVRNRNFDAVIGIGGSTAEPWLAGKLTWAALFPHQIDQINGNRILNFEHFLHLGSKGPLLETDYPLIARRMNDAGRAPLLHNLGATPFDLEIKRIWVIVELAPRSAGTTAKHRKKC